MEQEYSGNHILKEQAAASSEPTFAVGSVGAKTKEAACKMFPNETWEKKADGVWTAQSRKPKNANQKRIFDKEIAQAKNLAKDGHIIFLTPEPSNRERKFDGFIDGEHTLELKLIEGSLKKVGKNFNYGAEKAEVIFLETTKNFRKRDIFNEIRGEIKEKIKFDPTIVEKLVYVKIKDLEIYELDLKAMLS